MDVLTKGAPSRSTGRPRSGGLLGHLLVLDDPGAEHGRGGGQVHQGEREWEWAWMRRWPWPRWALAAPRHDQSEERHRVLHLGEKGLMGMCPSRARASEARCRVTPGATSHPEPGAVPGCSDRCAVVVRRDQAGPGLREGPWRILTSPGNWVKRTSPSHPARPPPGGDGASGSGRPRDVRLGLTDPPCCAEARLPEAIPAPMEVAPVRY